MLMTILLAGSVLSIDGSFLFIFISILCLIFNRPVGSVAQDIILSLLDDLEKRLSSMPGCPENWPGRDNRTKTLGSLAQKLQILDSEENG